jgi:hypothetical protein
MYNERETLMSSFCQIFCKVNFECHPERSEGCAHKDPGDPRDASRLFAMQ